MVVYATALVLGLPQEKNRKIGQCDYNIKGGHVQKRPVPIDFDPAQEIRIEALFSKSYFQRLEKMAEFTIAVTKPNRNVHQIGDNDNGRFLKMDPSMKKITIKEANRKYGNLRDYITDLFDDKPYWDENHLDHRHIVAAINGLFARNDFNDFVGNKSLETVVIRELARGLHFESYKKKPHATPPMEIPIGSKANLEHILGIIRKVPNSSKREIEIPLGGNVNIGSFETILYPDFGLYIFRSRQQYLAIRCGSIGLNGLGVHAHNDQLTIELNIDGKDILADPGTYLYTPLSWRRNEYRSVKAHFTARVEGREPGRLDLGLFELGNESEAKCLYFGKQGFAGVHYGFRNPVWLVVLLTEGCIRISYAVEGGVSLTLPEIIKGGYDSSPPFSPSYGAQYE
jgi:hypothetical protein